MLMTLEDLIKELKLSRATIYRSIKSQGFPAPLKFGKSSRWRKSDVETYFNNRSASQC
ncbi:AlpA family transcriptional regulator [Pseudomonas baetica]|uniref:AlpA family transcriptional regulator n=2 Tax=Pseudomonas TaxID=286 RepID=A0ABX4Q4L7_9PSED|nr:helix-turn-helix domain-containing protein [Pseudomonas sp. SWRI22]PKA71735.1 AlpA family transcriptional regulator [Pseudomonas baetica]PTC20210.1 transcriptional regulator [Pseudomonas baetica]